MAQRANQTTGSFYSYSTRRNLRQEEISAYRRIALATLLIVGLLVAGYFLGIPFLSRLGSGSSGKVDSSIPLNSADKIPPTSPKLDSLPDAVRTKQLTVTGSAEIGTTITVKINNQDAATTITAKDGTFSTPITLQGGPNSITATAKDTSNNVSQPSKEEVVVYDAKPPALTVSNPADTDSTVSQSPITVIGKTEPDASVLVNDRQAVVQSDGSFSTTVDLNPGPNQLVITATDKAGNITKMIRNTTYNSPQVQSSPSAQPAVQQ